jgi:hemoglobin
VSQKPAAAPTKEAAQAPAPSPTAAPTPPPGPPKPLFDRLGGKPAIAAVVDAFVGNVAADKRINQRFGNTDIPHLKVLLVEFFCMATGGPCQYTGRDMRTAHASMNLVDEEFGALVEALVGALKKLNVPQAEQNDLLAAAGPLKAQIVNPPSAEAAKHDPALAQQADARSAALRQSGHADAADLLDTAILARKRGQRSYADQLYSAAELLVPNESLTALAPLFRAGAPRRITTPLKMATDTKPQPKTAVGSSDEDAPPPKPLRGSLGGTMTLDGKPMADSMGVIMLEPVKGKWPKRTPKQRVIEQRERQFAPRIMAVPVGSTVSFPNFDPIYHNVFSRSESNPFDLGIYKNGQTRDIKFDKEGIIRLGCNLHANMSAHLIVVAAPHYAVTDSSGAFNFRSLEPGKYKVRAWSDRSLKETTQIVDIKPTKNSLTIDVHGDATASLGTDKFGAPRGQSP